MGPPRFLGRLKSAYFDPRAPVRGIVAGIGLALAYSFDLAADNGGARFFAMFAVGALCYAGVDLGFDAWSVVTGDRGKLQTWRLYALGALLGGFVAGALGWYFDAPQVQVVVAKFWAYADVNYRLDGRRLGDFTTYPIFNKYGMINLGEVAGGVAGFSGGIGGWRHQLVACRSAILDQLRAARRRSAKEPAADLEPRQRQRS